MPDKDGELPGRKQNPETSSKKGAADRISSGEHHRKEPDKRKGEQTEMPAQKMALKSLPTVRAIWLHLC